MGVISTKFDLFKINDLEHIEINMGSFVTTNTIGIKLEILENISFLNSVSRFEKISSMKRIEGFLTSDRRIWITTFVELLNEEVDDILVCKPFGREFNASINPYILAVLIYFEKLSMNQKHLYCCKYWSRKDICFELYSRLHFLLTPENIH